jgi:hypothetical protein
MHRIGWFDDVVSRALSAWQFCVLPKLGMLVPNLGMKQLCVRFPAELTRAAAPRWSRSGVKTQLYRNRATAPVRKASHLSVLELLLRHCYDGSLNRRINGDKR